MRGYGKEPKVGALTFLASHYNFGSQRHKRKNKYGINREAVIKVGSVDAMKGYQKNTKKRGSC